MRQGAIMINQCDSFKFISRCLLPSIENEDVAVVADEDVATRLVLALIGTPSR